MTIFNHDDQTAKNAKVMPRLTMGRMLTSALPFIALAIPGTAMAQQVSNTATVTAPSGTTDTNTANNSATDTDDLLANITANDDSATTTAGGVGVPNIISILDDDFFNGAEPTAAQVDISVADGFTVPPQLVFDTTDGTVDVAPGTPAGEYSFDYEICEAGTDNCDIATVTVTVVAPVISADDENLGPIVGSVGQAGIENALDGDLINGTPATVGAGGNVTLTVTTPAAPLNAGDLVPTLDVATGLVSVPAGTPADDYQIFYQICDVDNISNCADAVINVQVTAATILADDDSVADVDGTAGTNDVLNVLPGDTLNGDPATVDNIDISVVTPASSIGGGPVPTLDIATGSISVPPGTPAGTYTIRYEICEELNPDNCTQADAVVTVVAPEILAENDGPVTVSDGVTGADDVIPNVLVNDTLNGAQATLANVDITVLTPAAGIGGSTIVPVLDPVDGTVDVPANTPAGTYTITYQIEDENNPGNTATGTATVVVAPSVDLSILKTNGVDDVMPGETLTYVLTVSNAGPDAATGAVVADMPGAGLTCPATGTLTFGGTATAGAPAGNPTVGDLTGAGITLGTIENGQNVTITYTCTVD